MNLGTCLDEYQRDIYKNGAMFNGLWVKPYIIPIFNEINLDTKIKTENHEMLKWQSNCVPFEEMRQNLGYRTDNVEENRLWFNMVEKDTAIAEEKLTNIFLSLYLLSGKNKVNLKTKYGFQVSKRGKTD